jgi:hypothetical protein
MGLNYKLLQNFNLTKSGTPRDKSYKYCIFKQLVYLTRLRTAKNGGAASFRNCWDLALALAVRPPTAIILAAVIYVLIAGIIALFLLDGMDQVILGHFGVILDPQATGLGPDVFHNHNESPVVRSSVNFCMSPVWY